MPEVRDDIVDGVNYGEFRSLRDTPSHDPFKLTRDLTVGDFVTLNMGVAPFERTYEVTRVWGRGEKHSPGVELLDMHTGHKGIMTQASLNRIRPLWIYHPRRDHTPVMLTPNAIYQDITTGHLYRAAGVMGAGIMLYNLLDASLVTSSIAQFSAIHARPKLVTRWHPDDL